jgi:hypothetical protein
VPPPATRPLYGPDLLHEIERFATQAVDFARARGATPDLIAAVVARYPRFVDAWARLGELTTDDVESYAYFRIGYHRGLDALRGSGWRGSGYVRWSAETNRGFLAALSGLGEAAGRIGEQDEVDRIAQFLHQLDPDRY